MRKLAIAFFVHGAAVPQGSMRSFGHFTVHANAKTLGPWREAVASKAREAWGGAPPMEGAVALTLIFRFLRPASAKKRPKPTVKPDIDKTTRAVLDALTGIVYRTDAQVTSVFAQKVYCELDPGVNVIAGPDG